MKRFAAAALAALTAASLVTPAQADTLDGIHAIFDRTVGSSDALTGKAPLS